MVVEILPIEILVAWQECQLLVCAFVVDLPFGCWKALEDCELCYLRHLHYLCKMQVFFQHSLVVYPKESQRVYSFLQDWHFAGCKWGIDTVIDVTMKRWMPPNWENSVLWQ